MSESKTGKRAGQVAIITGAAGGIGFGIAKRFAAEGAAVAMLDMNEKALADCKEKLGSEGFTRVSTHVLDATKEDKVQEVFASILGSSDLYPILIQAAGITGKTGINTHEVELANFELVLSINTTALFLGCKHIIPYMKKQGGGRIINIASIAGKEGNAGMLAYSTSKAAVIGLTKVVGKEYAKDNITCNAIAPAVVRTAMVEAMPEHQVKYMTDKIPMGRCGKIEEIAAMCSFIASEEAAFTTGFTFDATGGRATY